MRFRIFFLLFLAIVGITITYLMTTNKDVKTSLPVYNPIDLQTEMVDSSLQRVGFGHKIGDFSFLNQNGETVTHKILEGNVSVVEYFFTTCGTICPIMNSQMQRVSKAYASRSDVRIFSFTVLPEIDTVEQMARYAKKHLAKTPQWNFLTGKKEDLYHLARTSFFVLKPAEAENLGDEGNDFIHTNNFVLIDKEKRIRGYYDGTNSKEVTKLIADIAVLLEE
jgi:protein SCO1/2